MYTRAKLSLLFFLFIWSWSFKDIIRIRILSRFAWILLEDILSTCWPILWPLYHHWTIIFPLCHSTDFWVMNQAYFNFWVKIPLCICAQLGYEPSMLWMHHSWLQNKNMCPLCRFRSSTASLWVMNKLCLNCATFWPSTLSLYDTAIRPKLCPPA